jgi:hypothetical protein
LASVGWFIESLMRSSQRALILALTALFAAAPACKSKSEGTPASKAFGRRSARPQGRRVVLPTAPETMPVAGGPKLGSIAFATPIYASPDRRSEKVGYLRAGGQLTRAEKPAKTDDCEGGWYRVLPSGFVCATGEATTDLSSPILRALTLRPDPSKPLPYPYGFVRAIAPNYYRVPSKAEQFQYEMALDKHLRSYGRLHEKWDALEIGSNDIELDAEGNAVGLVPDEPPPLDYNKIYGGSGSDDIPVARERAQDLYREPGARLWSSPTASRAKRCSPDRPSSARTSGVSRSRPMHASSPRPN